MGNQKKQWQTSSEYAGAALSMGLLVDQKRVATPGWQDPVLTMKAADTRSPQLRAATSTALSLEDESSSQGGDDMHMAEAAVSVAPRCRSRAGKPVSSEQCPNLVELRPFAARACVRLREIARAAGRVFFSGAPKLSLHSMCAWLLPNILSVHVGEALLVLTLAMVSHVILSPQIPHLKKALSVLIFLLDDFDFGMPQHGENCMI